MNNVFELVSRRPDLVVVKVNCEDPLTAALNPYVSSDMAYVSVTRGKEHVMTITRKDGTHWSFHWGDSGYTLIGEETKQLQRNVVKFIEKECLCPLEGTDSPIENARMYYNENLKRWQLSVNEAGSRRVSAVDLRIPETSSVLEAIECAEQFITTKGEWITEIAATGITVYRAQNPSWRL